MSIERLWSAETGKRRISCPLIYANGDVTFIYHRYAAVLRLARLRITRIVSMPAILQRLRQSRIIPVRSRILKNAGARLLARIVGKGLPQSRPP